MSHWLSIIPTISGPSKALEIASLSVCTSRMSHNPLGTQNEVLSQTGLKLYIQGLQAVQKALTNPNLMYSDQTLAACLLLAMFEIYECPAGSRKAYLTHQDGVAQLVYLRGPERHQEGLGHSIFLAFRSMSVSVINMFD
jgi:Fungal specific transcription factor domain